MNTSILRGNLIRRLAPGALLLLLLSFLGWRPALSAGTGTTYPTGTPGFRASTEWRTSTYGGQRLLRRTLWNVYAEQGEYILLASSAVGVTGTPNQGDILVFNPGRVTGEIGREDVPQSADFSCVAQRAAPGEGDRGRIGSRADELAGPNRGYRPCYYQAPATGIYNVALLGPEGRNSNREIQPSGQIEATAADFGPNQATSVTAWDITVADSPQATADDDQPGRVFVYYFALITGGNARPLYNDAYVATSDGFIYRMSTRGADPFGFVFYSNKQGFLNTDGNPLYRNVMAQPTLPEQDQNQLVELQGDVRLALPEHPIFIEPPAPEALQQLGIPLEPLTPVIANLAFTGPTGTDVTSVGEGGTFSFDLVAGSGNYYYIVVSRDGVNFDPTLPQNRVLYGNGMTTGRISVAWDGRDNAGELFPTGDVYRAGMAVQGGEVHFPALDIENNREGSVVRLINPPGGICPPFEGGCTSSFYDDRGYRTADGTLVGVEVNGPLCPGNVGNPPRIAYSDPIRGYDSTTAQRGWGFAEGGNPPLLCAENGGFGDKKGLDRWSYYPSNRLEAPLRIVAAATAVTLIDLRATHTPDGIQVSWTTGVELDSRGFHLYRATGGERDQATRVTPALIPARGSPTEGASYRWLDAGAAPDTAYTYWLVEVETGGQTNELLPVRALPLAAGPGERIYLPIVIRF